MPMHMQRMRRASKPLPWSVPVVGPTKCWQCVYFSSQMAKSTTIYYIEVYWCPSLVFIVEILWQFNKHYSLLDISMANRLSKQLSKEDISY